MPTLVPRTPRTPRGSLSTPRRLFSTPRRSKMPMMNYSARARFRNRRAGRTASRRSVRELVQDITQEKKHITELQSVTTPHSMVTMLIGRNIDEGGKSTDRISSHINLTGISIKGTYTNQSNATKAFGGNVTMPTTLKIWIVRTRRNDSPIPYWFQSTTDDTNVNYNTGFTSDPTGDVARLRSRMNLEDITVLATKTYTVNPPVDIQQNFSCLRRVNMFLKFKKPIVLKYSVTTAAAPPFGATDIMPNVYVCFAIQQPNTQATVGQTLSAANLAVTTYWRE